MTSSKQKENHTMRTALGGVTLLLTVAAAASGCGGSTDSTTPPATTSPADPSSSSTPQDQRSEAAAAAQAMIRKYFAVTDRIGQDPSTPLSLLKTVDVSFVLSTDQHTFSSWRAKGWRKTGNLTVTKMQVETISLDNSNPAKGHVPYVAIAVCTDATGVDVVDKTGKSVVLKSRPTLLTTRYTVANYHWKTDPANGWRVAGIRDEEVGRCTL
jgi:hypothetical protein